MKIALLILGLSMICLPISILARNSDAIGIEINGEEAPNAKVLKKNEAEKWLADFTAAREKTADALFLKNFEKRQTHTRSLMALREQADKLFGDVVSQFGDCTKAIEAVNGYWKTEIALITDPANNQIIKTGSVVALAWEGGMYFVSCRNLIAATK